MANSRWRPTLALAGILLLIGGPLHPRAEPTKSFNESTGLMLANPNWPIAHAGPTPVLTTHMTLAVVAYPVLGFSLAALAFQGAKTRSLGVWAIAWLGILGGLAHGISAPIVVLTRDQRYSPLFTGGAVLALWLCLAAVWPIARARQAAVDLG